MNLVEEYKRQFPWRRWERIFNVLPPLEGQFVLDLGCGVGDQAAELERRGARILGFDMTEEVLSAAPSRGLKSASFRIADLRALPELEVLADGIWSSFATAYLTDLPPTLRHWSDRLRTGGWVALTEIDDMFGHHPLTDRSRDLLNSYCRDALRSGRYDFSMGHKLRGFLEQSGFQVEKELILDDLELSFSGPALPAVVESWTTRMGYMTPLQKHCGTDFPHVRDDFLACLSRPVHHSTAKVYCCIARK